MKDELWDEAIEVIRSLYVTQAIYCDGEVMQLNFSDSTSEASIRKNADDVFVYISSSINDDFLPHVAVMNRTNFDFFIDLICDAQNLELNLFEITEVLDKQNW